MRYARTRKQETRERLLDSSRALAKERGFEAVGVDALMGAVGLSGGAFYGHFESKAALFEALIEREMTHSQALLAPFDAAAGEEAASAGLARSLRCYLGTAHAADPASGCALPALGPEIARAGPAVRTVVERALRQVRRGWQRRLGGDGDRAWALLAQCVGAVVLARAVESARTRSEILAASRRHVETMQAPEGDAR